MESKIPTKPISNALRFETLMVSKQMVILWGGKKKKKVVLIIILNHPFLCLYIIIIIIFNQIPDEITYANSAL